MTETKPACRSSHPAYMNPENKMCGSCAVCNVSNPYNPDRAGICNLKGSFVKLTAKKECWR